MKFPARLLPVVICSGIITAVCGHAATVTGRTGTMPAYYDSTLLTINAQQLPGSDAVLAHNSDLHPLYFSEAMLPGGGMFVTVLSAKPGDQFNPLWQRTEIVFNAGVTPRQFFSDDEVTQAVDQGLITLHFTGFVFRCAVIGPPATGAGATSTRVTWGTLKSRFH